SMILPANNVRRYAPAAAGRVDEVVRAGFGPVRVDRALPAVRNMTRDRAAVWPGGHTMFKRDAPPAVGRRDVARCDMASSLTQARAMRKPRTQESRRIWLIPSTAAIRSSDRSPILRRCERAWARR